MSVGRDVCIIERVFWIICLKVFFMLMVVRRAAIDISFVSFVDCVRGATSALAI